MHKGGKGDGEGEGGVGVGVGVRFDQTRGVSRRGRERSSGLE